MGDSVEGVVTFSHPTYGTVQVSEAPAMQITSDVGGLIPVSHPSGMVVHIVNPETGTKIHTEQREFSD